MLQGGFSLRSRCDPDPLTTSSYSRRKPYRSRSQKGASRVAWLPPCGANGHHFRMICGRSWRTFPTVVRATLGEAANLKTQGVLSGIPDLIILAPGPITIFIEMKASDGRLSLSQRMSIGALLHLGIS